MSPHPADSAGVPWAGRSFDAHPTSADDGSAPPRLLATLRRFHEGGCSIVDVVEELRGARLLVPLVAELGQTGIGVGGVTADKSADLGIVTVSAPDGRRVLPVFTSVASMAIWNTKARPVPSDATRVALAAASEGTELVVIDAGSSTEVVVRRPAVWAIAQASPWVPCYLDSEVLDAFLAAAAPETSVSAVLLDSGDPSARLAGPELTVTVAIRAGMSRGDLDALLQRLSARFAADELITHRVDSMALKVVAAPSEGASA